MAAPKNIEELALRMGVDEQKARWYLFDVVDFLVSNSFAENALDNGMYYMPRGVREDNLEEACQEIIWATYQNTVGEEVDKKMWVNVSTNGINISVGRLK